MLIDKETYAPGQAKTEALPRKLLPSEAIRIGMSYRPKDLTGGLWEEDSSCVVGAMYEGVFGWRKGIGLSTGEVLEQLVKYFGQDKIDHRRLEILVSRNDATGDKTKRSRAQQANDLRLIGL